MSGLRLMLAAVALVAAASCGTSQHDSPAVAPGPSTPSKVATKAGSLPEGVSLVLASSEGVDLMSRTGDLTRIWHGPAAAAYGVHDVVVFQGSDGAADVYPPSPDGPVVSWSDGSPRELPLGHGASGVRLLDAGRVDGRPVVLVAERFTEAQPDEVAEALVLIDLEDLSRLTVVPRRPAWESGYQSAHLRPDGDIVGLHHQGVQVHLVRWSSRGDRVWSVNVAEDRVVGLVASDAAVAVVQVSFDERRGFAPVLTVTHHDPATGDSHDPTVVDVIDPEGVLDAGVFCRDWLTASELACARSGGPPVAVSVVGSFHELGGPPGAIPSVVQEP